MRSLAVCVLGLVLLSGVASVGYTASAATVSSDAAPRAALSALSATWSPPPGASEFVALAPARLVDTRIGLGAVKGASTSVVVTTAGVAGVPASGVAAVSADVTVTGSAAAGYVSVVPGASTSRGATSTVNFGKGETRSQSTIAQTDAHGRFSVNSSARTQVIVDVTGYFLAAPTDQPAGRYVPVSPARLLDTRKSGGPIGTGATRVLKVAGVAGIPNQQVSAVVVNLTAVAPTSAGYLTAYPGTIRPPTSSVNFTAGGTRANRAILALDPSGRLTLFNSGGKTNVLVDVTGYFTTADTGNYYVPTEPTRFDDTRGTGVTLHYNVVGEVIAGNHFMPPMNSMTPPVAVAANLTVVASAKETTGYANLWASGASRPATSDVNFTPSTTASNLAITTLGAGALNIGAGRGVNYVFDVVGYFAGPLQSPTAAGLWRNPPDFTNPAETPQLASSVTGVREVASSGNWTDLLRSDGTVEQLESPSADLSQVPGLSGVTVVAGGALVGYALKNDGTVWAWGNGANGRLGDGTTTLSETPVQVSGLSDIVGLGAAGGTGYAIDGDGDVWAWGANSDGRVGDGTTTDRLTPVRVTALSNVVAISGNDYYADAVESDGSVWQWGLPGETTGSPVISTPTQVSGVCPAKALSPTDGIADVYTICSDGTIAVLGQAAGSASRQIPDTDVTALASSSSGLAELHADGTVWADSLNGMAPVPGLSGITAIGPGDDGRWFATTGA